MHNRAYYRLNEWFGRKMENIENDEMAESSIELTPLLVREIHGKTIFLNPYNAQMSESLNDVIEKDCKFQLLVLKKSAKKIFGVKPMYDDKQQKMCFVYYGMDTGKIFTSPFISHWEEECRIYFFNEPQKRGVVLRNNYDFFVNNRNEAVTKLGYLYSGWHFSGLNQFIEVPLSLKNLNNLDHPSKYFLLDYPGTVFASNGIDWMWNWSDALKPFRDIYGNIVPVAGNKMVALDNIFSFVNFMTYSQPEKKTGKKQERFDFLMKKELPDAAVPDKLPEPYIDFSMKGKNTNLSSSYIQRFAVIQKVPDIEEPICVLRTFFYAKQFDCLKEGGRIYIGKKEILASKILEDGSFMYQTLLNTPSHWDVMIDDFDEDAVKGTKLEYYSQIMHEIDVQDRGLAIWAFLKWPVLESMYKIEEFRPFMKNVFTLSRKKAPMDVINLCFCGIDKTEKNPYKMVGLNKQQVEYLMPIMCDYFPRMDEYGHFSTKGLIYYLKLVLKTNRTMDARLSYYFNDNPYQPCDISDVDIETVKYFAENLKLCVDEELKKKYDKVPLNFYTNISQDNNTVNDVNNRFTMAAQCIVIARTAYGMAAAKKAMPSLCKHSGTKIEYQRLYINYLGQEIVTTVNQQAGVAFKDYVQMVTEMEMTSRMKPFFDTPEQIIHMHDHAVELMRVYRKDYTNHQLEKWNKQKQKNGWKRWEFEDGEFKVIAPEEPADLTEEGIALHHCVGGYIKRVSEGETNIVFIRKKDDLKKPFYTVEIEQNHIQQVHGLLNCCASKYPGLTEFVEKWAKEKNLITTNYNKVR